MAVSAKLGEAFVEFSARGYETIQTAIGGVKKSLVALGSAIQETQKKLATVARSAALPFTALVGIIAKSAASASPGAWE